MKSSSIRQISSINKNIYDKIRMGKVVEKYTRTKDKKDLQMWVIYPPDFDQAKKYPALLFCEGGPQSSLDQFWSYRWNMQMIAAKGYSICSQQAGMFRVRTGMERTDFRRLWRKEYPGLS
ncbi:MAG: hypothetical protein IPJ37_15790 [Bacteroidales bacterium]|nr:hypothetical protein [Bacteroidales bacterium]